ncbi:hypothetical protein BT96DRAFT_960141 [Gymnopus androsaceus JB14]|uniref:Prolyl 4-hydroxylase alpha subunit Fe(2+) 2OG dioxygenase domain-containing protein n=1 Tax=Gymnopus androsaceus JB14 TaxID=1447944 RepID=A0A6A4GUV0_9AGAR|nr:hypothetical protein BT96DRAFT_960141 [Gymnopus androsaceus JB14]
MKDLWEKPCFRRIAGQQSGNFFWNISVYSCFTVNFGPSFWSYIHTDSKNDPGACCAITAGGDYDPEKGGHLILWDLKVIIEFPPGCTILLPSALLCHSNIPPQKGKTRVSFTQYTAGSIFRWLDFGGRTEEAFEQQDPEGYKKMLEMKHLRWEQLLANFCTLDELKGGLVETKCDHPG